MRIGMNVRIKGFAPSRKFPSASSGTSRPNSNIVEFRCKSFEARGDLSVGSVK